ncbi:MAG: DNA repair protein RecO [Nitrospinae bacterium]|nr:DNA repair protein RecO [Nitrospinota bacterium]
MPLYNDEAITLRHYDFGEADRIVSFFGRRHGKVRVVAKGARKLKSRFAGRLEPFHKVAIVYFGRENANLYKLSNVDFRRTRAAMSDELERFHRACYVTELMEAALREGDPNPKAFLAANATLELIARETRTAELDWITRFFDVRFLSHIGYTPTLDRCVACRGGLPETGQLAFDAAKGGIVCPACRPKFKSAVALSAGAAKFMAKMLTTEFGKAVRLKPSPQILREITSAIIAFRNSRIQVKMNSERFFGSDV